MHYYSPHTGELIRTETPADWMAQTHLVPPAFDAQEQGCFFRNGNWVLVDPTPEPGPDYQLQRAAAYTSEADPLFFQEQRGEVPVGAWDAKVLEIKARFPKP